MTSKTRLIEAIIADVCDLPDYNSPDDRPTLLQCTTKELSAILERRLADEKTEEQEPCVSHLAMREYEKALVTIAAREAEAREIVAQNRWPSTLAIDLAGIARLALNGAAMETDVCRIPPQGWRCTRKAGHEGPCAAWPV